MLKKSSIKILVVDDEPSLCKALARILSLEGYASKPVNSGQEAIETLRTETYHVMILDMYMPGMSGVEVMAHVRENYPELAIIVLTGNATLESAIEAARTEGVINYLLKPSTNSDLLQAVEQALQKQLEKTSQSQVVSAATQMMHALQHLQTQAPASTPIEAVTPDDNRYIEAYPLKLDVERRVITDQQEAIESSELTEGEFTILKVLMLQPGKIFSCRELVDEAFGYQEPDKFAAESVIRPHISRLRQKLEASSINAKHIRTVRQRGYMFQEKSPKGLSKTV